LATIRDPGVDTGFVWSFRYRRATGAGGIDLLAELRQGYAGESDLGTLIRAETLEDIPEAWTQADIALTAGEAALATDFENLFQRFVATAV
jgi:hypothetical protein